MCVSRFLRRSFYHNLGVTTCPKNGGNFTELARRAALEAVRVGTTPRLVDRNRKRDNKQVELNLFLRHLYAEFFKPVLKGRMPGTLAIIASVVLKREITKESVVTALRHVTK
jgi:hypothetical protein